MVRFVIVAVEITFISSPTEHLSKGENLRFMRVKIILNFNFDLHDLKYFYVKVYVYTNTHTRILYTCKVLLGCGDCSV